MYSMLRIMLASIILIASGCSDEVWWQGAVKKEIGKTLKDPYSAQYQFIDSNCGFERKFCSGEVSVNAKNSFGAYAGNKVYTFHCNGDGRVDIYEGSREDAVRWLLNKGK